MNKQNIPRAQPVARLFAVLLCLILLGVVFVIGRELWSMRTGSQLESWLEPVFHTVGRARFQTWMFPAGIVSAILGLLLLLVSVWPRRATHSALDSESSIWIRSVDLARMCTATAEKVPGVLRASSFATPRSVTITLVGDSRDETLTSRVTEVVAPIINQLSSPPTLQVRIQQRSETKS